MKTKKKLVLIPSACSYRAMGDVECFIPYYREKMNVFVIIDDKELPPDGRETGGVRYVRNGSRLARYLIAAGDYIIDAGALNGSSKVYPAQKRISVWHGIPYKAMFVDLAPQHVISAYDYNYGIDLMISPSKWYTEHFLRQSLCYKGDVLETAVSRTDSLFLDDREKAEVRKALRIPEDKKVLLYAPTFRVSGDYVLPFSPKKVSACLGPDWVIVTKLHYLNNLKRGKGVIDATDYPLVNNLLAVADLMVTDYSSLLFDYSILRKPAVLYQYDRYEYESDRSFMFDMEDYVDSADIVFTEEELCQRIQNLDQRLGNLEKVRRKFYPHQAPHSTAGLVEKLDLDTNEREVSEVVFLVNELNQIGGVHSFVLNLARQFKERYGSKIIVIGNREFDPNKSSIYEFDPEGVVDIKLSADNDLGFANGIIRHTDGYIISCQFGVHLRFQKLMKDKKAILMFHGDTKDVVNRNYYKVHLDAYNDGSVNNYRRLALLTRQNKAVLDTALVDEIRDKTIYVENGMEFNDKKNLYKESGHFAFVARLDEDKNPLEVVEVFANERLDSAYHLDIYGDGALRDIMEQRVTEAGIGDKVTFHGYVSDKEEIYRDKQGVLLASLSEGLPFTVLEATKYGIPVYIYDAFTSCGDIVTDSTGVLVPAGDKEAFVTALNESFAMDAFDSSEIEQRFSNSTVTDKWKALFDDLDAEVNEERIILKMRGGSCTPKKKSKKKLRLSRRVKNIVRSSALFRNNTVYQEIAAAWRNFKHPVPKDELPLVSVIMPFYNNIETVRAAVRSVVKCGYRNCEIILVNDGWHENPVDALGKYAKYVTYFYKENGGLSSARNFGMEHATGKFVIFLDSDDVFYPGGLPKMVAYAEEHGLSMVSGKTVRHYLQKDVKEVWYPGVYTKTNINNAVNRWRIIDDTIATGKLYRLNYIREIHLRFQEGLYEDVLFTGELYSKIDRVGIVSEVCQIWKVYGSGTSITTSSTLANAKARFKNVDRVFDMQPNDIMRAYYTRQYVRHQIVAAVNGFACFTEEQRGELYDLARKGLQKRATYIYDKLIAVPSKKALYKALLDDDYERFSYFADGYSHGYLAFHSEEQEGSQD